jgi:hypothetical protein
MSLQTISTEDLNVVTGAVSEGVCRAVGATAGALIGGAGGFYGLNPVVAGLAAGSNLLTARSVGTAAADVLEGAASMVPGPIGAVGGAYTYGRMGANTGAVVCGYR